MDQEGVDAFPDALSPFFLLRVEKCPVLEMRSSLRCRVDGEVESQFGLLTLKDLQVEVTLSPVIRLTLDPETRRIAHIHERAVGVAFMYPMETEDLDMGQLTVPEQAALKNGAFAMFSFFSAEIFVLFVRSLWFPIWAQSSIDFIPSILNIWMALKSPVQH